MEPSNSRSDGNTRGRRTYYGRRYPSNHNRPHYGNRSDLERTPMAEGLTRDTEEPQSSIAPDQGRHVNPENPRQRGPRSYPKQQVSSQDQYRHNQQGPKKHYRKRGNCLKKLLRCTK